MKLTESKLKKMIYEELKSIYEKEEAPAETPAGSPEQQKADPTKSIAQLKQDLLQTSKSIQNVKGLAPKEIELISATLGTVLQAASQGSAATLLQRINDVIQKQIK